MEELRIFARVVKRIKIWLGWCPQVKGKKTGIEIGGEAHASKIEPGKNKRIAVGQGVKYRYWLLGGAVFFTIPFSISLRQHLPALMRGEPLELILSFLLGILIFSTFFWWIKRRLTVELRRNGRIGWSIRRQALLIPAIVIGAIISTQITQTFGLEFLFPFVLGGLLSILVLYFLILKWERRNKKVLVLKRTGLITTEIVAEEER